MKKFLCLLFVLVTITSVGATSASAQVTKEVISSYYYEYNKFTGNTRNYGYTWIFVPASAYITEIADNFISENLTYITHKRNYFYSRYN